MIKTASFTELKSYQRLQELAKDPIDLTKNLTPERIEYFFAEGAGLKLLYGTERVTDQVIEGLYALAQETDAVGKMQRMQRGEITNVIHDYPSENRPVLHTAMRQLSGDTKPVKEAILKEQKELKKLESFLNGLPFTNMIAIGIGGSNLGPECLYRSLGYYANANRRVHFLSNVDPDNAAKILHLVDLKKTLVVTISKSGSTIETVTNEEFIRSKYLQEGLDPNEHFVSVTGEGSPMDDKSRYLECFYSWDFVGGRFCTSAIYGAVILSFAIGLEPFKEFLYGAHEMDQIALNENPQENLPLLHALLGIWNRNFLNHPIVAVVPYSRALDRFAAHVQQLDMESNGKHVCSFGKLVNFETGPIIFGEPGTNAQHSFYQLIHQGTTVVPVEMIGFRESQYGVDFEFQGTTSQEKLLSNLFAQSIALATGQDNKNPNKRFEGNRPSRVILGEKLTAQTMGALWSLYENKVAFQGFVWGINSFDQEGVQLGKVLANRVLKIFEDPESSYPLGEAFLSQGVRTS